VMSKPSFVYVTYIRTTAEKLWRALLEPEFTRQYWFEVSLESEWKRGAAWRMTMPDGRVINSGEVLEIEPQRRLVLSWRHELQPELRAEGYSRMTYLLEPEGDVVKLTTMYEIDVPDSKFIAQVSNNGPQILASLKSLLETGAPFEATRRWPKGM
jgi:uncharacterized protein YndB with AHSA1/START domain